MQLEPGFSDIRRSSACSSLWIVGRVIERSASFRDTRSGISAGDYANDMPTLEHF